MSTCQTCGKDFTGGYVKHAIKDHPRKNATTRWQARCAELAPPAPENPTPTGVTGGDLAIEWDEHDIAHAVITHTPTRESRSPVRTAAKAQVKTTTRTRGPRTPVVSARSARTESRNSTPKRERDLRAELRQARRSMRRIERALAEARS